MTFEQNLRQALAQTRDAYARYAAFELASNAMIAGARDLVWRAASITGYPSRGSGDKLSKYPEVIDSPKHGLLIRFTWEKYLGGGEWEPRKPIEFPARFLDMKPDEWGAELYAARDAWRAKRDARTAARKAHEEAEAARAEEDARLRAEAKEWETFKALQIKFDPYAT